jgi:hypothetical protein
MQTFQAQDAPSPFDDLLDLAQQGPVRVLLKDRVVGEMVSAQDYEAMRQFHADRLQNRIDQAARSAAVAGLTDEGMRDLLADES